MKKLAFVLVVAMSIVGGACGGKKPAPQTPATSGATAPDNKMEEAPKTEGSDTPAAPEKKDGDEGGGDSGGDGGGDAGGDPCGG